MNPPNQFAEDPREFSGPPQRSSAATTVIVVIVVIGGILFVACAGIIVAGVYMFQQTRDQFEPMTAEFDAAPPGSATHAQQFMDAYSAGDYPAALRSVEEALALDVDDAAAHNNKAWLLATCLDEQFRDGKLAVEHATRACELTDWQNAGFIDTLAAAYAEEGDYEAAVRTQQQAIDLDTAGVYGDQFVERLELYQTETPYRESPAASLSEGMDELPPRP